MDPIVKQAMLKWPHVPHCFGWLGLDARGNWYMRDERAQAAGRFASGAPGSKGSLLQHQKLIEFIGRNYACDGSGRWYFQNGPQRVYVELEATPWVWRVDPQFQVQDHIGTPAAFREAWMDENGWLYLLTSSGFGLVHTQDVGHAADAIEQGVWAVQDVLATELPVRYGYTKSPCALQQVAERT